MREIARDGIPHCCIVHDDPTKPPSISIGIAQRERRRIGTFKPRYRETSITELSDLHSMLSIPKLLELLEETETEGEMSRFMQTAEDSPPEGLPVISESAPTQMPAMDISHKLKQLSRPVCAMFSHSLERNGANNFLLFLSKKLIYYQEFVLFAPKDGPMKKDFELQGVPVEIMDPTAENFHETLSDRLLDLRVGVCLCNTMMRADVVMIASSINIKTVWVIHEAWPQDQIEHYAKEVFLMAHIDADLIRQAFRAASCLAFPSQVQKEIYQGMYDENKATTIYNGIPLAAMDHFKRTNDRDRIRAALGYKPDDFVVLHIGTICFRKGQIYSSKAFSKLVKEKGVDKAKLLMVGARYIRDHEIKYIGEIQQELESNGITWCRYEDTMLEDRSKAQVTIMDIQSQVYRFYHAADVVIVPSLNEVLPLVVCEAMSFRTPVIASAIAAIPEAMDDGKEGYLIQPEDPDTLCERIFQLYQDPELRSQLGAKGRQRVLQQFAYDVMGRQYRVLLDDVCNSTDGGMRRNDSCISIRSVASEASTKDGEEEYEHDLHQFHNEVVLVDMDNTIADWDTEFLRRFSKNEKAPAGLANIIADRSEFEIEACFSDDLYTEVINTIKEPGFYFDLEPLEGALDALNEMLAAGLDVRLVSSPHPSSPALCAAEKYQWVDKYLGSEWVSRLVIVKDKTYISGLFLIDDKPTVTGSNNPSWKHIVFDHSYNRKVVGTPRLGHWKNWRRVVAELILNAQLEDNENNSDFLNVESSNGSRRNSLKSLNSPGLSSLRLSDGSPRSSPKDSPNIDGRKQLADL